MTQVIAEVNHKINAVTLQDYKNRADAVFCCSHSVWLLCKHPSRQPGSQEIHLLERKFPTHFPSLQPSSPCGGFSMLSVTYLWLSYLQSDQSGNKVQLELSPMLVIFGKHPGIA